MVVKKLKKSDIVAEAMTDEVGIPESKSILITKEGLAKLKEELKYLEQVKRMEVAARIKEAVSYGDLSENSEYEDAKNEQAFVEGRIMMLNEQVKYAKLIDEEKANRQAKSSKTVQLGNTVKIKAKSGKLKGETFDFTIVGTTEADPMNQKISNESPVGAALLEHPVGAVVKVKAPAGEIEYEILDIL